MLAYRLPLAYGERVGRFSWAGHVASSAAPRHRRGRLSELHFSQVANGFDLHLEKRDVQLSGVVEIALPAQGAALAATQEFDGETYLYAEPAIGALGAVPRPAPRRVAIYWDASASGAERDHARELAVLMAYFERYRKLAPLVTARQNARNFTVRNADRSELRHAIEATVYDGASNFAPLAQITGVDEALLFSDGLANYGDTAVPKSATPIHAVSAAPRSDATFLRALAEQSGGRYADAGKLGSAAAAALLLTPAPLVTIESAAGIADALLASPYAENGRVHLAGRLTEAEGRVVLRIAGGGSKPTTVVVPVRRAAGGAGFAAQRWAALKVAALEADYELNRAQVERLGKRFRLITRGTSLIVLDNARDYARFDIEPPPELRAEYERLRLPGCARARRIARLTWSVVRQFQDKQAWWGASFQRR